MKILYAASEARPFIASGGLGDVAGSLPGAVTACGQDCRVVIPLYGDIPSELRAGMRFLCDFTVNLAWRRQYCGVFEAQQGGVTYYFIDNEYYFRRGGLYGFYDDGERFAFFSKAVVDMLAHIDWTPGVIHCNDWQTAMIPVYLNSYYRSEEPYHDIKTVFTIHNIQYQGQYSAEIIEDVLGISKGYGRTLMYDGCCNMMKGAIEQADAVTTVSPTYAYEILDEWYGHGMDRFLREQRYKLSGILNGIDTRLYDPAGDPNLYMNYDQDSVFQGKSVNKQRLQRELGLSQNGDAMLIGIVSRLVSHKGVDLIKYIFGKIIEEGMQVVVLGSGEYIYESFFEEMAALYPDKVAVRIAFDPTLASKIYAASDVFLMPSKSEPCGLSQMVALRYGAIPVVRKTGGLADSITDMGDEGGNGYTFVTYNAHDMFGAIKRAQAHYYDKPAWEAAVRRAMECDFSWSKSARTYVSLYASLSGVSEEEIERAIHEREKSLEASNSPQAIQPVDQGTKAEKKPAKAPAKKPAAGKAASATPEKAPAKEKAPAAKKTATKAPAKKPAAGKAAPAAQEKAPAKEKAPTAKKPAAGKAALAAQEKAPAKEKAPAAKKATTKVPAKKPAAKSEPKKEK